MRTRYQPARRGPDRPTSSAGSAGQSQGSAAEIADLLASVENCVRLDMSRPRLQVVDPYPILNWLRNLADAKFPG